MSDKYNPSLMGRRRLLQTLAGLGVSSVALAHMTDDAVAQLPDDLDDEVPRLMGLEHTSRRGNRPERRPAYYTISRERWGRVEGAKDARRRVDDLLDDVLEQVSDEFTELGAVRGDVSFERSGSGGRIEIVVDLTRSSVETDGVSSRAVRQRVEALLPTTIDGVANRNGARSFVVEDLPVRVDLVDEHLHDYYDHEYRPVASGAMFEREDAQNSLGSATLGPPVYDPDIQERRFVTAAHALDGPADDGEEYGETEVWQPRYGDDLIGEYTPSKWRYDDTNGDEFDAFDACVVDVKAEYDASFHFASDDWSKRYADPEIVGTISKEYIGDLAAAASGETIAKRGKSTGYTEGTVTGAGEYTFKVGLDTDTGDSGGPYYATVEQYGDEYAYIGGIHKSGGNSFGRAVYMDLIETEFNVTV